MIATTDAIRRVVTRYGIGPEAEAVQGVDLLGDPHRPELCGEAATRLYGESHDAAIGANSRVLASDETNPVAGPSPSRFRKLYPSMPMSAPTVMPRTITTPAVPPPTTSEPLPQAMSDSNLTNSFR